MPYQTKTLELNNQYVDDQKMNIEVIYEYTPDREMPFLDIVDIIQLSTGHSVLDIMDLTEYELIKKEVQDYESSFSQKQCEAAQSWMTYAETRAKDKTRPLSNMEARALQEKIASFYD